MALAEASDIATRIGRSLSAAEEAMVEQSIEFVTGQIVDAVDRDEDWATDLDPVPAAIKGIVVEKVVAIGSNPNGLRSESKTLGKFTRSKSFVDGASSSILTDREERIIRNAIYQGNGSSTPRGLPDRLVDIRENRDVDEPPPIAA